MNKLFKEFTENYLNKIDLGYRLPPEIKLEEFWKELYAFRRQSSEQTSLKDQKGDPFWFFVPRSLNKKLHEIDSYGRDTLYSLVKAEIESDLIRESLIEEAFYSSVIEGAFSTLKRAKELVIEKSAPKDNSEQMILNNFYAMRFILENKEKELSPELVLSLHKIVTEKTLEQTEFAGNFRDDMVYIVDGQGRTVYAPPPAKEIPKAMQELINWANLQKDEEFIHPIIKATILHFYFVYLHPFFDGNGRTARALFYYYLIKNQYDFFKYFSISSIINDTRGQYYKALKDVEDFDSDLTYFLVYMADSILKSVTEIKNKIAAHYRKDYFLAKIKEHKVALNNRQEKIIKKILLWKDKQIDINKYMGIVGVVYQTARVDLFDLADKGLLQKSKKGRKFIFTVNFDI